MSYRIPLSCPSLSGSEEKYLQECIVTNYVSSIGPFVTRFEAEFAEFVGAPYAVACASGTSALHLALAALGVGADDEVWVSDLTFIASANPALYCGARVTLVDSEDASWNLDAGLVVAELEQRARSGGRLPAAIVAVHLLGHPARLDLMLECAAGLGVPVVEDAAEALGASWRDGPLAGIDVGAAGAVGCFSFNGNKLITTGGGGMLVTADRALAATARHLATQARLATPGYQHDAVGFNYRMTNVAAALGCAQLASLREFLATKRAIADRYDDAFGQLADVQLPPRCAWATSSMWLYTPLVSTRACRDRILDRLASEGIEARPMWTPLHAQLPYRGVTVLGGGGRAEAIACRGLSLPSSVGLTVDQQDEVIAVFRSACGA